MPGIFSEKQIGQFIQDGFVRIDRAFSGQLAEEVRTILWQDMDGDPHDPATWARPVVWLGMYTQKPFVDAANTPVLHQAFDELVGPGRWVAPKAMGSFPVRFPSHEESGDDGWHVDASFPGTDPSNYFEWRVNVRSKGRGLLMLFLFSDVSDVDAPTRIRVGSHRDVARLLQPAGEQGLSFVELAGKLNHLPDREDVLATGEAGTVYLCHPFLAHAAQRHQGSEPRFLAQPPLLLSDELRPEDKTVRHWPVEEAIRLALRE